MHHEVSEIPEVHVYRQVPFPELLERKSRGRFRVPEALRSILRSYGSSTAWGLAATSRTASLG